jgi:hypothetical protein
MSYGKFHKDVREACESAGWVVYNTYNDKHKDGSRRISYSRNGWPVPDKMKAKILANVKTLVKEHNIDGEVYWFDAYRHGYGDYDKLCVLVK